MQNLFFALLLFAGFSTAGAQQDTARLLIDQVVAAVGGQDAMYALHDIAYDLHARGGVSRERYIFDGEASYGKSMTKEGQEKIQYFDGQHAMVTIGGKKTTAEDEVNGAMFSRKTNFYWLTMMHKLADPGLVYTYTGTRLLNGIPYEIVDLTFENGVGVAKDRYLLYINPYTHLVDQFLFTVNAVGRSEPLLMKYWYDTVAEGVKFPVVRTYRPAADWGGEPAEGTEWGAATYLTNFQVNQGFTKETLLR